MNSDENDEVNESITMMGFPYSLISILQAYLNYSTTQLDTKPAPSMAAFSSIGPRKVAPEILKPDIIAAGVSVIAAYTGAQGPTNRYYDKRRIQFNAVSGTSMTSPHVVGIVGLLKTLHPYWSPAAIKSTIMTTARVRDNMNQAISNASHLRATPFSYGTGHVQPNRAMDHGLVYDLTVKDYLNFLCALGYSDSQIALFLEGTYKYGKPATTTNLINLNYPSITEPSITEPNLKGPVSVTRTLKNVGSPGSYRVRILSLKGVKVVVYPTSLQFKAIGEEKSFKITLDQKYPIPGKDYVFGQLIWSDGKHYVRSPISVKAFRSGLICPN